MALKLAQPVRIEDPDEPFLKQAEEIAFEFINLRTKSKTSALTSVKAPIYPKKAAGEPGLLRAEEGEVPQAEPELLLPASLPQLGADGQQRAQRQATQAQATGHQEQQATALQLGGGQPLAPSRVVSGNNNSWMYVKYPFVAIKFGHWGLGMELYSNSCGVHLSPVWCCRVGNFCVFFFIVITPREQLCHYYYICMLLYPLASLLCIPVATIF